MQRALEIKNKCISFLHGHYPITPNSYYKELLDSEVANRCGPDRYGQGDDLQGFENELSEFLGHEDCVFLQSGTMAQLIALRIWSEQKDNPLIAFHPTCHLELHEHMAYSRLHNLRSTLVGQKDRLISIEDLKEIKTSPSALLLELPQREIGGQLPNWNDLVAQVEYLRSRDIIVHLDGARIWECAPFYKKTYQEICGLFDSVYISFYKGIGAVSGAALLGSSKLIREARIWNRRHGGNLVTCFPTYASAKFNFNKRIKRFDAYYTKTLEIAEELSKIPKLKLVPEVPQVNMFHLFIEGEETQLREKALIASEKANIWGFAHLQKVEESNLCKLEWYVGDATMDLPTKDIIDFVNKVISG